jgi:hypothetical protein
MADESLAITPESVGRWLCHYTTADAAFEHILPTGELRMSPYRLMRDPLEEHDLAFAAAWFPGSHPEAEAAYWGLMGRVAELRGAMRLLSLTMDAEDYSADDFLYAFGWARARLWEQHASNHAGVCLVFNRQRLHAAMVASLNRTSLAACRSCCSCRELRRHGVAGRRAWGQGG